MTTDGPQDQENWYEIWKMSAAIVRLCVSNSGRPGVAYGMGEGIDCGPHVAFHVILTIIYRYQTLSDGHRADVVHKHRQALKEY